MIEYRIGLFRERLISISDTRRYLRLCLHRIGSKTNSAEVTNFVVMLRWPAEETVSVLEVFVQGVYISGLRAANF